MPGGMDLSRCTPVDTPRAPCRRPPQTAVRVRHRIQPLASRDALLVRGDALGLAGRGQGFVPDPLCGRFLAQLRRGTGSGREGFTLPGAGLIDDGVPPVAVLLCWSLEQMGGPGALPRPDDAGDISAWNILQTEGQRDRDQHGVPLRGRAMTALPSIMRASRSRAG